MRSITARVATAQALAVAQSRGSSYVDAAGQLVTAPTVSELALTVQAALSATIGQSTPPPMSNWRMSNNALSKRVDAAQAQLDTVDAWIQAATQATLDAVLLVLQHQADQHQADLRALGLSFTAALAQARTDLHAEMLGNAGPLLDTITQIKALQLSDEAHETTVHDQLFALLGSQSTQLTQLLASTSTLSTTQAATSASVATLQTSVSTHSADIAALKLVDTGLRSDLTTAQAALTATTATANGAQALATSHTALIQALQTSLALRLPTARLAGVRVATPAILAGAAQTVTVSWPTTLADANYQVVALPENASLIDVKVGLVSRTATTCVLTFKNAGLVNLAVNAGFLHVIAFD